MGVAMADMCVAIETVDGCLSTTDSAAGDGSKTRDESTQQLALPTGLDTILAGNRFLSPRRPKPARRKFLPYARKYRSEVENAV
jgi:hypothetical protein